MVSGLASGIDAAAHAGGARRRRPDPRGHRHGSRSRLSTAERGAAARRSPLAARCSRSSGPTRPPRREHFPLRNALMSGLTRASIIVEAGARSGTRIQARAALVAGAAGVSPRVAPRSVVGAGARRRCRTSTSSPGAEEAVAHPRAPPRRRAAHRLMATVAELTAPYTNLLRAARAGRGVCERCWNLTDGYRRCYACARSEQWLAAVTPISYSVAHEQLHHVLAGYKRWPAALAAHAAAGARGGALAPPGGHEALSGGGGRRSRLRSRHHGAGRHAGARPRSAAATHRRGPRRSRPAVATAACSCAATPRSAPRSFDPERFTPTGAARRRGGAADRRHVDLGRERPERGRGAALSGRRRRWRRWSSVATSIATGARTTAACAVCRDPSTGTAACTAPASAGAQPAEPARRSDSVLTPRSSWLITGFIAAT